MLTSQRFFLMWHAFVPHTEGGEEWENYCYHSHIRYSHPSFTFTIHNSIDCSHSFILFLILHSYTPHSSCNDLP